MSFEPTSEAAIYFFFTESGVKKRYDSLQQMLQIIIGSYLSGAYYTHRPDGRYLEENTVLFRKVENQYFSEQQKHKRESNWQRVVHETEEFWRNKDRRAEKDVSAVFKSNAYSNFQGDLYKKHLIEQLRSTFDERAIHYLCQFLNDNNSEIIASAAYGLGELKAREKYLNSYNC